MASSLVAWVWIEQFFVLFGPISKLHFCCEGLRLS